MKNIEFVKREKCCICGSEDLVFEQNIEDFDSNLGMFELIKCNKCGMYYTSPYPSSETLPNLYTNRDTRNFDLNNSCMFTYIKDFLAKRQIRSMARDVSNKNLLIADIGCGDGRFAAYFQEIFYKSEVHAFDFSDIPPERIKNLKGKAPKYFNTRNFYDNNVKYDIIFLRYVVEHVENPKEFLGKMITKLSDNGYIHIEVPNIKNGLAKLFNRYLPSYYPPYHLLHYTKENLAYMLSELGQEYEISQTEMPLMSNLIANMLHQKLNNIHRLLGVFLHPLQMLLCINSHTILTAKITRKK